MSEYIPFEIQIEIIKRLPVKSLLQFRSVSKPWKSLIDSCEFIAGYKVHQTYPHPLLVSYRDTKEKNVLFIDDEVFTQQELAPIVPVVSNLRGYLVIVGSSQGLMCFFGSYQDPDHPRYNVATNIALLWNPYIRRSVCIPVPGLSDWDETVLGFGVCPVTSDPTIVKITNVGASFGKKVTSHVVEVFTMSRGCWRTPSNLPKKSIEITSSQVNMGGLIYWLSFEETGKTNLVISFDMTTQEFRAIDLPKSLSSKPRVRVMLSISKVLDYLAVLEYIKLIECETQVEFQVCDVWVMDPSVSTSFTKLFTVDTQCYSFNILGFKNSGEPIMEKQVDLRDPPELVVYDPISEQFDSTGIHGEHGTFFASSYMETLLLLDHPDGSVLF